MINIFNKKRLILTNDPMGLANVKLLLGEADIKYSVKTKVNRGVVGRNMDVNAHRSVNFPYSGEQLKHTYYLYVRKKDYTRAEDVISSK